MTPEGFSPHFTPFLRQRMNAALAREDVDDTSAPRIRVDEAMRTIARFYEKTRNTLEYGERDFLLERAIERSLKRLVNFGSQATPTQQGVSLLRELIRAGYFPNNTIREKEAEDVGKAIERLLRARHVVNPLFHDELLSFAAFEIEDMIFTERAAAHEAMAAFVIHTVNERLHWPRTAHSQKQHRAFLFIAAHRAVLHASRKRILYAFVAHTLPEWFQAIPDESSALPEKFERTIKVAKLLLADARSDHYTRVVSRFTPAFISLNDAVSNIVREARDEPLTALQLERFLEEAVGERIGKLKTRLRTNSLRATVYVFFTKMIFGFAIELPYEYFVAGGLFTKPFFINLLFPPLLMFLIAFSARPPGKKTAEGIIDEAMRIAYEDHMLGLARLPEERGTAKNTALALATVLFSAGALYGVMRVLNGFGFSFIESGVFLIFVSLVSLFGWRVRRPLREFSPQATGGLLSTVFDIFFFPFLALGRILSGGIKRVNVFLFVVDVFIEAPLKFLFAVAEDWIAFVREKKDELIKE